MYRARRVLTVALPAGYFLTNRKVTAKAALEEGEPLKVIDVENLVTSQDVCQMKLYGYNGCPYRGKVKAFLNYHGYDFEEIELNPFWKKELKEVTPGYEKSPVLQIIGPQGQKIGLMDSGLIITTLEKLSTPGANFDNVIAETTSRSNRYFELSDSEKKKLSLEEQSHFEELAFDNDRDRIFVNKTLLHTIAPNIYPYWREARKNCYMYQDQSPRFKGTLTGNFIAEGSAIAMTFVAGMVFKKYRDHDKQTPTQYLYSACDKFMEYKGANRFIGGEWPSTADLEAYGLFTTFHGTEVLFELSEHKPIFYQWFQSMKQLVESHHGRI